MVPFFESKTSESLLSLRICWTTEEDGWLRRWCHLDDEGLMTLFACLFVDDFNGYITPSHLPCRSVLLVSRSLVKNNEDGIQRKHNYLGIIYEQRHGSCVLAEHKELFLRERSRYGVWTKLWLIWLISIPKPDAACTWSPPVYSSCWASQGHSSHDRWCWYEHTKLLTP